MTELYKDELVKLAKKVLKPKVYDDTRHILESLRAIPEPGGSLSAVSGNLTTMIRGFSANNLTTKIRGFSANTLHMDDTYSCDISGSDVVGRVNQNRSALKTGVSEGRDSFMSRLRVGLHCVSDMSTSMTRDTHTTVNEIIQVLSSQDGVTLHLLKTSQAIDDSKKDDTSGTYDAGEIPHGEEHTDYENRCMNGKRPYSSDTDSLDAIYGDPESKSLDSILHDLPDTYQEAISGPDKNDWLVATSHEV